MIDLRWYNAGAPWLRVPGTKFSLRLWNLFNRRSTDGHFWGVGIVQVGSRHLLYVGHSGVSVAFVGQPGKHATWREQMILLVGRVYLWLKAGELQR